MIFEIATLFPEMCESVLSASILGRARAKGIFAVRCHQIRDYTADRHRRVDDAPFGGGRGLLMQAQPVYDCWRAVRELSPEPMHTIYLSPKGTLFRQNRARELALLPRIFLLCGHYEGVDERVIARIADEEISMGDYVLTGGELPALALVDAVARLLPGVLPGADAYENDSLYNGLLEYPQYTRPEIWEGERVPEILLSGDHEKVRKWRFDESLRLTRERRPDLWSLWSKENGGEGL